MTRSFLMVCVIAFGLALPALGEDYSHGSSPDTPQPYPSRPVAQDTPVPVTDEAPKVPQMNDALNNAPQSVDESTSDEVKKELEAALQDLMMVNRGRQDDVQAIWGQRPVGEWQGPTPGSEGYSALR